MRALYLSNFDVNANEIKIEGEQLLHLNVVRAKQGDQVLLLDGCGSKVLSHIVEIHKKYMILRKFESQIVEPAKLNKKLYLFLALPKKDAFVDILKIATECGVTDIFPLSSEYSQFEFTPSERYDRVLESSLIQSNNLFIPKIHSQAKLHDIGELYRQINASCPLTFMSSTKSQDTKSKNKNAHLKLSHDNSRERALLIGPEGGFSIREEQFLSELEFVEKIHLPTPIMRSATAAAVAIGYLLAE